MVEGAATSFMESIDGLDAMVSRAFMDPLEQLREFASWIQRGVGLVLMLGPGTSDQALSDAVLALGADVAVQHRDEFVLPGGKELRRVYRVGRVDQANE